MAIVACGLWVMTLAGVTEAKAETVRQKQAAEIAELFFNAAKQQVMSPPGVCHFSGVSA